MKCDVIKNNNKPRRVIWGLLVLKEGMMSERSVAVSSVIQGLGYVVALLSWDVISVSRGGGCQQMRNAIRWIKHFAEKISAKFVPPVWKRRKLSILQRHPVEHRRCYGINNVNSSPLDRPVASVRYFLKLWCQTTAQYSRTRLMTEVYQIASRSILDQHV